VVSPATDSYSCVMVNSGKAFAYVPGMCGAEAVYGNTETCIEEATKDAAGKEKKAGGSH
jgi:predicted aconitase